MGSNSFHHHFLAWCGVAAHDGFILILTYRWAFCLAADNDGRRRRTQAGERP